MGLRTTGVCALTVVMLAAGCSGGSHSSSPGRATDATTTSVPTQTAADIASIRRLFDHLNAAYRVSPAAGYQADAQADYFANEGPFSRTECVNFWRKTDGDHLVGYRVPLIQTLTATPGWVVPLGGKPRGRVYALKLQITASKLGGKLPNGSSTETGTQTIHVEVLPDGTAELFIVCTLAPVQ